MDRYYQSVPGTLMQHEVILHENLLFSFWAKKKRTEIHLMFIF